MNKQSIEFSLYGNDAYKASTRRMLVRGPWLSSLLIPLYICISTSYFITLKDRNLSYKRQNVKDHIIHVAFGCKIQIQDTIYLIYDFCLEINSFKDQYLVYKIETKHQITY